MNCQNPQDTDKCFRTYVLLDPDVDSSETEERYVNIGVSAKDRILVLIHTERQGKIRIISCRKATVLERRHYEEG